MLAIQELPHDLQTDGFEVGSVNMIAAAAASAVLNHTDAGSQDGEDDGECDESADCVVEVKFRFTSRPEWLQPGMRFVVRDQLSHMSGTGVVLAVS